MNKELQLEEDGDITNEVGYTISNNIAKAPPIIDTEDEKCYAKIVITQCKDIQKEKFYVKGTRSGFLLNPFDNSESDRQRRVFGKIGQDGYFFVPITQVGFKNYLEYLRSQNSMYYKRAEWELKNAN
jgi:hypothetical protein